MVPDEMDHQGVTDPGQPLQRSMTRRSVIRTGMMAGGSLVMSSGYIGPRVETVSLSETLKPSGKPGKGPKPPKPPKPPKGG